MGGLISHPTHRRTANAAVRRDSASKTLPFRTKNVIIAIFAQHPVGGIHELDPGRVDSISAVGMAAHNQFPVAHLELLQGDPPGQAEDVQRLLQVPDMS